MPFVYFFSVFCKYDKKEFSNSLKLVADFVIEFTTPSNFKLFVKMEYELAVKKLAAKCEEKLLKMEELQDQLNEKQQELEQVERCSIKSSKLSKLSLQFAENQHAYGKLKDARK